jgi:hypothetical protein
MTKYVTSGILISEFRVSVAATAHLYLGKIGVTGFKVDFGLATERRRRAFAREPT